MTGLADAEDARQRQLPRQNGLAVALPVDGTVLTAVTMARSLKFRRHCGSRKARRPNGQFRLCVTATDASARAFRGCARAKWLDSIHVGCRGHRECQRHALSRDLGRTVRRPKDTGLLSILT